MLLLQHVKIRRRDVLVLLDDDVAGAKEAETFTERMCMYRETGGHLWHAPASSCTLSRSAGPKASFQTRRRGIARIAGPRTIVFGEEFLADVKLAAHLLLAWMCEMHVMLCVSYRTLRSGFCMVKQRSAGPSR